MTYLKVSLKSLKVSEVKCTYLSKVQVQINYTYIYMHVLYILYTRSQLIIGLVDYRI